MKLLHLKHRPSFLYDYLKPALDVEIIEMTIPDKTNSSLQKYRLTKLGDAIKKRVYDMAWLYSNSRGNKPHNSLIDLRSKQRR